MMRQADASIRTLLRMQAERQKAEDACRPAAMERAGYWFRSVTPVPEPVPEPPEPPLPSREGDGGRGPAESPGLTRGELPKLEYGAMTPAERYVTLYPDRAATILAAGGLPAPITFPPPDQAVITELLTGNSPLVRAFRHNPAPSFDPVAA
jgi:hypothetical protein